MDLVAFAEQEFRQVRSILAGDAGDESLHDHLQKIELRIETEDSETSQRALRRRARGGRALRRRLILLFATFAPQDLDQRIQFLRYLLSLCPQLLIFLFGNIAQVSGYNETIPRLLQGASGVEIKLHFVQVMIPAKGLGDSIGDRDNGSSQVRGQIENLLLGKLGGDSINPEQKTVRFLPNRHFFKGGISHSFSPCACLHPQSSSSISFFNLHPQFSIL
ncbi:MAG: hypothetical protein QHH30_10705, partial [candidate division NC10 bacterium]|nr:hypothetical protein [candidate division NC10 bacterium]